MARAVPSICLDLIHAFEKGQGGDFAATSYKDEGRDAIGWGHDIKPGEKFDSPISRLIADGLALQDLMEVAADLDHGEMSAAVARLDEGQWAALLDFCFNVGVGRFLDTTIHRLILAGDLKAAGEEFPKWRFMRNASGQEVEAPGLVRRRKVEATLWNLLFG